MHFKAVLFAVIVALAGTAFAQENTAADQSAEQPSVNETVRKKRADRKAARLERLRKRRENREKRLEKRGERLENQGERMQTRFLKL